MPYLGNTAGNRFVASKAATQFSGDGSNTSFTLEHSVGSDEDILVSVDGVIQEPSVAYAVSNGTTLTFTAAPSNNSGNNIFVYYLFRTVGTVDHPATNALQATNGTFTDDLVVDTDTLIVDASSDKIGMGVDPSTMPSFATHSIKTTNGGGVSITSASASDNRYIFFGNGTSSSDIQLAAIKNTSSDLSFLGASGQVQMTIDANGRVTKPLQPISHTYFGDATNHGAYNAGTNRNGIVIKPSLSHIDVGSMYNTSTGRYTVPIAGKYVAFFSGSQYNLNVTSYHRVDVKKNGTTQKTHYNNLQSGGSNWTHMDAFTIFNCSANDYIEFYNANDGGGSNDRGGFDVGTYSVFGVYLLA